MLVADMMMGGRADDRAALRGPAHLLMSRGEMRGVADLSDDSSHAVMWGEMTDGRPV